VYSIFLLVTCDVQPAIDKEPCWRPFGSDGAMCFCSCCTGSGQVLCGVIIDCDRLFQQGLVDKEPEEDSNLISFSTFIVGFSVPKLRTKL
jgi:hypothetical protein